MSIGRHGAEPARARWSRPCATPNAVERVRRIRQPILFGDRERAGPSCAISARKSTSRSRGKPSSARLFHRTSAARRPERRCQRSQRRPVGGQLVDDVQFRGEARALGSGTLWCFLQDRELFDDLHETHRILKSQTMRLFEGPLTTER